jgi:hypothetical protein
MNDLFTTKIQQKRCGAKLEAYSPFSESTMHDTLDFTTDPIEVRRQSPKMGQSPLRVFTFIFFRVGFTGGTLPVFGIHDARYTGFYHRSYGGATLISENEVESFTHLYLHFAFVLASLEAHSPFSELTMHDTLDFTTDPMEVRRRSPRNGESFTRFSCGFTSFAISKALVSAEFLS